MERDKYQFQHLSVILHFVLGILTHAKNSSDYDLVNYHLFLDDTTVLQIVLNFEKEWKALNMRIL